ncbi:MAG TPA: GNAT family N-acetyltransferase [Thermomicrobiales bacterium]|nr:GNAT family N-acetyltransferase [Thermomicrobiales bacterium]
MTHHHGVRYARECGSDKGFEPLVAGNLTTVIESHDSQRHRCRIAERDDEVTGSPFLARRSETVARLHLRLVEPFARGLGVGSRLVNECVRFAVRPATNGSPSGPTTSSMPPAISTSEPVSASSTASRTTASGTT